ncbi:MAG: TSUP family transporter [Phycisphaerae bacterium]
MWLLGPWTLGGIIIGRSLFGLVDGRWIKLIVGSLGLAFVALQAARAHLVRYSLTRPRPWQPRWYHAAPFGLAAGVSTALAHAAGGIVTMFLLPQRLQPRDFVGTCARYYLIFKSLKVPIFLAGPAPLITAATLKAGLWLVPLAPLGVWAGARLNRQLSGRTFNALIYLILTAASLSLVLRNLPT